MRLKKSVLSLLRKLVRVEMSLMSDGSAFQARGPAMEKALLVTWNDEVAAHVGPKPGVVTAPDELSQVLWSSAMIDVKH